VSRGLRSEATAAGGFLLSHLSLGVSDLVAATAFYDAALGALGYVRVWTSPTGVGYGEPGGNDKLALFPREGAPLAAGPGFHLALRAPSQAAVDSFYAAALAHGGRCEGPPGLRAHYGAAYYAAFVRDPDGHKLEAVCQ
jgi:catechol 2,3-dioxygenase-like lactoylglutathione lyase family enzyme